MSPHTSGAQTKPSGEDEGDIYCPQSGLAARGSVPPRGCSVATMGSEFPGSGPGTGTASWSPSLEKPAHGGQGETKQQ